MDKSDLIKEVFGLYRRVQGIMHTYSTDAWLQLNLTILQVKSLFFITNHGTTNFKTLANALKVTPSNLTGVIDRLVEQGIVSRTESPQDRRVMLLKVTEKGESLVSELREKSLSYLTRALADLTLEDLQAIKNGLALLARAAETQDRGD
jgi:DNA-binding MarR family transcriptional regulator